MSTFKKAIFIILLITTLPAKAVYPETDTDFSLLPPYCKVKLRSDSKSAEYQAWEKRLGPSFSNVHHYCAGLFTQTIANRMADKNARIHELKSAVGEMEYVHVHSYQNFVLLPKIAFDQGEIYEQMDQPIDAMKKFQQSISLNPKNSQPYIALSNLYIKQNNKNEAIAILEQGLKYKPDSKSLRKHLEKITNGK